MARLANAQHSRRVEFREALGGLPQGTILLREAQVHCLSPPAPRLSHTCQSAEQAIANGAFALGMMTGIAFLAATLVVAKLLIM